MVVAWIALVLAGREHTLQSLGLEIACIHPGDPRLGHDDARDGGGSEAHAAHHADAHQADAADDDAPLASDDLERGDDCPAGCTDCACGAAPCAPAAPFLLAARTWRVHRFDRDPSRAGPSRDATALERPPRAG